MRRGGGGEVVGGWVGGSRGEGGGGGRWGRWGKGGGGWGEGEGRGTSSAVASGMKEVVHVWRGAERIWSGWCVHLKHRADLSANCSLSCDSTFEESVVLQC